MNQQAPFGHLEDVDLLDSVEVGSTVWRYHLGAALDEAVAVARVDVLEGGEIDAVPDAGSGVDVAGARLVRATRGQRECLPVAGDPQLYLDGLNRATGFRPVVVLDSGMAYVLPPATEDKGAIVYSVGPFTGNVPAGDQPFPGLHPLVVSAAEAGARARLLQVALEAAAVKDDGALDDLPELDFTPGTLPTPPEAPALTVPTLPAIPALPTGYTPAVDASGAFVVDEDSEMTMAALARQRALLEEWQADVAADVQRYAAQVQAYEAESSVYGTEVQAYAALLNAESIRLRVAVEPYLAYHVQGRLAFYGALLQGRAQTTQRLAQALQAAQAEHARRLSLISPAPMLQPQTA
ncbi:MAG TPA: hypothetical protein VF594_10945 [Rubricoccaceae bacterium]